MNIKSLFMAAVAACAFSSTASASYVTYTDRALWEAAVGGAFSTESFDDASTTGFTIDQVGSGHSTGISGGVYHDRVVRNTTFTNYLFGSMINAFGANWDLRPGGAGQGLQLVLGTEVITPQIPNSFAGGFFGVVSTSLFNRVTVRAGSLGGFAETHDVDNLVFASSVPEPETYALMLLGLAAVGAAARRRRHAGKV